VRVEGGEGWDGKNIIQSSTRLSTTGAAHLCEQPIDVSRGQFRAEVASVASETLHRRAVEEHTLRGRRVRAIRLCDAGRHAAPVSWDDTTAHIKTGAGIGVSCECGWKYTRLQDEHEKRGGGESDETEARERAQDDDTRGINQAAQHLPRRRDAAPLSCSRRHLRRARATWRWAGLTYSATGPSACHTRQRYPQPAKHNAIIRRHPRNPRPSCKKNAASKTTSPAHTPTTPAVVTPHHTHRCIDFRLAMPQNLLHSTVVRALRLHVREPLPACIVSSVTLHR
jgi:hypothetical protein